MVTQHPTDNSDGLNALLASLSNSDGKADDAYRTISEAADLLGLPQHVLRFWEGKFPQIKPLKRSGNRRYYRRADLETLIAIKQLLHEDGYTIRGVQKLFKEQGLRVTVDIALGRGPAPTDTAVEADAGQPDKDKDGSLPVEPLVPAHHEGDAAECDSASDGVRTKLLALHRRLAALRDRLAEDDEGML